uniref:Uncharacterized protein n=2 Tax=Macaca TaxID=9539 RepID=A0A2K6AX39_MACNE|nr:unnamed protein product [Macaca fascicularis]
MENEFAIWSTCLCQYGNCGFTKTASGQENCFTALKTKKKKSNKVNSMGFTMS